MPEPARNRVGQAELRPVEIPSLQIDDATTYEHAVGTKNTDRKNARANRTWFTMIARNSENAKVDGTMNAAWIENVTRLEVNAPSFGMEM